MICHRLWESEQHLLLRSLSWQKNLTLFKKVKIKKLICFKGSLNLTYDPTNLEESDVLTAFKTQSEPSSSVVKLRQS